MKLIEKTTMVPAISLPSERDREGVLTNAVRAQFGRAAVDLGTPDRGLTDDRTDAVDTVANIMHWLHGIGTDPADALESASRHFLAEIRPQTAESEAVTILNEAGIEAHLQHTGGGIMVAEVLSTVLPGRTVWVSDSEGREGGRFLVGAYPEPWAQEWIEQLSGTCSAKDLPANVRRALSQRSDSSP